MSSATLSSYTLDDLEVLANEHPELGRIEIIAGTLAAGGIDVTSYRHQSIVQTIFLLLLADRVADQKVMLDTYWFEPDTRLRPDVAIWNEADRPVDGGAFIVPPLVVFEVLSADADHDLVRKAAIYWSAGVQTWFVDPRKRHGWWLSNGSGVDFGGPTATIALPGRPDLTFDSSILDA